MRVGIAIDLHAHRDAAAEVGWPAVRDQALAAERAGFDLVVLPDHLAYRAGSDNAYSLPDEPLGVRESVTFTAAVAAATSTIGVGHSVLNAPYRTPAMVAHIAAALAEISGGRYSLGLGAGNTYDYDQLGVPADHRASRFEEYVPVVAALLRDGEAHLDGRYWRADRAELPLRPEPGAGPPLVIAAGGPRTMRLAAIHGDAWNGWCPTRPEDPTARRLLQLLDETCDAVGRDPGTIGRTFDIGVDPLDLRGAREQSRRMLELLAGLGVEEVRCYAVCEPRLADRLAAIDAVVELAAEADIER